MSDTASMEWHFASFAGTFFNRKEAQGTQSAISRPLIT